MLTMNPATGQMEDDYGKEPVGALVNQQEQAAAQAPSFIGDGSPVGVPNIPAAPGPNDVMPMSPDAGNLPLPGPGAPILADASQANTPGIGLPSGLPGPDEMMPPSDAGMGLPPPPAMPVVRIPDDAIEPITAGPDVLKPGQISPPVTPEADIKRAKAAEEAEAIKAQAGQQRQEIIKTGEDAFAAEKQRQADVYGQYREKGEKDVWGDNATRNKVMAGIATMLGGRSGASDWIITAAGDQQQKDKAQLAFEVKGMERAGRKPDEIASFVRQRQADLDLKTAAGLDATVTRIQEELSAQGTSPAKYGAEIQAIQSKAQGYRNNALTDAHQIIEQGMKDDLAGHTAATDVSVAEAQAKALRIPEVKPAPLPAEAAVPPIGRAVSPAMNQNLSDINAANAALMESKAQEGGVNIAKAAVGANKSDLDLSESQRYQARLDKIESARDAAIQKRQQQADADYQSYRTALMAKPPEEGFGTRLMQAIAIGMGAYSKGILGGSNGALDVIQHAAAAKVAARKEDIENRRQLAERSGKMTDEERQTFADELSRENLKHAAILDGVKTKLENDLAKMGVPEATIKQNTDIQKLGLDADQKRQDALDKIANNENALAKADIVAAGKKRKGAGTGVGGVGLAAGAQKVADAITNGAENGDGTRRELTPKEKMAVATANGIKLNGKSSETTLDSINKMVAFDANAARKAAGKGGTGDADAIKNSFKPFRTEAIGTPRSPGPVAELSKIEEMRKTLEDAAKSGDTDKIKTAMVKAKEQAGTLMSGGKMTVAQVKIMHDLESKVDEFVSTYGKWTGNPTEGAGAVRRLTGLIETAGDETAARVKSIRDRAMEQHLAPGGAANTPEKKRAFENENAGVFSGTEWRGKRLFQEGEKAAARQGGGPAPQAAVSKAQRAAAIVNDPSKKALYTDMQWKALQAAASLRN